MSATQVVEILIDLTKAFIIVGLILVDALRINHIVKAEKQNGCWSEK